jgi:hypothetical protein
VLINSSLLVAGVATLIQCLGVWKFGVHLPVMTGATSLSVTPMISMGLDPKHRGIDGVIEFVFTLRIIGLRPYKGIPHEEAGSNGSTLHSRKLQPMTASNE